MNYILLHYSYGRESMKMVAERMTEPCMLLAKKNSSDWVIFEKGMENFQGITAIGGILEGNNSIINWGNHIFSNDAYFSANIPSAIALASDKARSRIFLQEVGVSVPVTVTWGNPQELQPNYPLIARTAQHHGGNNFYVLNDASEINNLVKEHPEIRGGYFSEVFEKDTEFRVHCAHGRILMVQEKPLVEGELRANQAVNHEKWTVLKWGEINPKIALESLKAIEALGLDYGAVDIMYNSADNSCAICEVNTSPSINTDYSSGKYAKYFSWLIRNDFPEHFSLATAGKNGYVFDNEMLGE